MEMLLAFLIVGFTTAGQILLKKGATINSNTMFNIYIVVGYVLFLITIIVSYYLMKQIPMKYFTVIMSMNYLSVMFAAHFFLKEQLDRYKLFGTLFVAIGIVIFMGDKTT